MLSGTWVNHSPTSARRRVVLDVLISPKTRGPLAGMWAYAWTEKAARKVKKADFERL